MPGDHDREGEAAPTAFTRILRFLKRNGLMHGPKTIAIVAVVTGLWMTPSSSMNWYILYLLTSLISILITLAFMILLWQRENMSGQMRWMSVIEIGCNVLLSVVFLLMPTLLYHFRIDDTPTGTLMSDIFAALSYEADSLLKTYMAGKENSDRQHNNDGQTAQGHQTCQTLENVMTAPEGADVQTQTMQNYQMVVGGDAHFYIPVTINIVAEGSVSSQGACPPTQELDSSIFPGIQQGTAGS